MPTQPSPTQPRTLATDIADQLDEAREMLASLRCGARADQHAAIDEITQRLTYAKMITAKAHARLEHAGVAADTPEESGPRDPISFRNKNLGNLRPTAPGRSRWRGEIDTDNGYAKFSSYTWGVRAMLYLLRISYRGHGLNTIDGIIDRYAPHGDNEAASVINYKRKLAGDLGVETYEVIDVTDKQTLYTLARGIAEFESGRSRTPITEPEGQLILDDAYGLLPL